MYMYVIELSITIIFDTHVKYVCVNPYSHVYEYMYEGISNKFCPLVVPV